MPSTITGWRGDCTEAWGFLQNTTSFWERQKDPFGKAEGRGVRAVCPHRGGNGGRRGSPGSAPPLSYQRRALLTWHRQTFELLRKETDDMMIQHGKQSRSRITSHLQRKTLWAGFRFLVLCDFFFSLEQRQIQTNANSINAETVGTV